MGGTAVVAVAVLTGTSGVASASTPRHETIQLDAVQTSFAISVDNAPKNEINPGDSFVFSEKLYKAGTKTRVGTDYVQCTQITKVRAQCLATFGLNKRGTITVQGVLDTSADVDNTLAVTGGTAEFRAARGTFTVHSTAGDDSVTHQTFRLVLP